MLNTYAKYHVSPSSLLYPSSSLIFPHYEALGAIAQGATEMVVHEHVRVEGSDGSRGFFPAAIAGVVFSGLPHSPETYPCAAFVGPVVLSYLFLPLLAGLNRAAATLC